MDSWSIDDSVHSQKWRLHNFIRGEPFCWDEEPYPGILSDKTLIAVYNLWLSHTLVCKWCSLHRLTRQIPFCPFSDDTRGMSAIQGSGLEGFNCIQYTVLSGFHWFMIYCIWQPHCAQTAQWIPYATTILRETLVRVTIAGNFGESYNCGKLWREL